ncbi:capsular polysaccharide export protein, LipB/KpsS family [Enterobacter sp. 186315]
MIGFYMETIENSRFYCRVINGLPVSEQQNIIAISPWQEITDELRQLLPHAPVLTLSEEISLPTPDAFREQKPALYSRIEQDIYCSREYLIQKLPFRRCWDLYLYLLIQLMNQPELERLTRTILCSGNGLAEKPAALFCQQKGIATRYTELANFPNKVFIDPKGTNARSVLAERPECLDLLPEVSDEFHANWMAYYEAEKRQPPLQARNNPCTPLIDEISQDRVLPGKKGFIFLPLQVSYDTQLWLNADLRNQEAILHACRAARHEKRQLVVKIHPAETAPDDLLNIARLQRQHGFLISQENTLSLINAASRVITINSTVGMEAMLYHKPVELLGRAFYQHFDQARLKKYLHHYLFTGVEVRADTPISEQTARAFLRH